MYENHTFPQKVMAVLLKMTNFASEMKYGTILAIDDNPAILTALRICLEGTFERVLTLPRPDGVLALLQQEKVDVILLDMNFTLGVNSGQEGLTWLASIHRHNVNVPIVLITAFADIKLAVKALKMGAADFVTKPWDNDDLIRTLKDAIEKTTHVDTLESVEADHIKRVVDQCHGNISRAAELLGITRQTLYAKMRSGERGVRREE